MICGTITVNPRISPRGLIVNFEILHGGLIEEEGAYSREGAYWKGLYFGLIRSRVFFSCYNYFRVGNIN